MKHSSKARVLVMATYFGGWPVWFPAFVLSCARNETIDWLFFTDCKIPDLPYENIRFERMTLAQLNELATQKLGFIVDKGAYSQIDLQPTYGVIFGEYLGDYDFWGYCDIDVIWGDIRRYASDHILDNYDIVSFRKEFLAGHLTLWRNEACTNRLFNSVPAHREILADREYFSFDEDIISTHIKTDATYNDRRLRVYWPEQAVAWFRSGNTPDGWYWDRGRIFDPQHNERVYLHYQHWKTKVNHIDFEVGEAPDRFVFTDDGIWSQRREYIIGKRWRSLQDRLARLPGTIAEGSKQKLRLAKRLRSIRNSEWARKLAVNSIPTSDVSYDKRTGELCLERLGIRIGPEQSFILDLYDGAKQLAVHSGVGFQNTDHGQLCAHINELNYRLDSAADLLTLKRLYVDGVYNLSLPVPVVVLDVAMNTGLSSIYLASKPNVLVIGCEPCLGPFERTLSIISANPQIADRITPINVGVGPFSCRTIAGHLPKHVGAYARPLEDPLGPQFEFETIEVVDIVDMIDHVADNYPERALVLKIETDNPEYYVNGLNEISLFRRIITQGRLHKVHALLMKWHTRGQSDEIAWITTHLTGGDFAVVQIAPYYANEGMLFATRGVHR